MNVDFSTTHGNAMYRSAIEHLIVLSLPLIPQWESLLLPSLSGAVDAMVATGHVPIETADAFFDVGHFCHRLAEDIMRERARLGLPSPEGPDDA